MKLGANIPSLFSLGRDLGLATVRRGRLVWLVSFFAHVFYNLGLEAS
jgi:hypothetical protein